jgi:hypothetical protein
MRARCHFRDGMDVLDEVENAIDSMKSRDIAQ